MNYTYIWGLSASLLTAYISMFFKWENKEDRLKRYRKIANLFAVLSSLPLIIVAAARLNPSTPSFGSYEFGYSALVKLFELFSDNYNIFNSALSAITVGIYCAFIYRESENPAFSIIMFFLGWEFFSIFENTQFFLSIAVLTTAVPLIKKGGKNWIYVSLITLAAISIDNSAAAVIPFYLVYLWTPQAWISGFIILAMYPLGDRFRIYLESFLNCTASGFDVVHFSILLMAFVIVMVVVGKIEKKKQNDRLLYCASIFGMSSILFTLRQIPSPIVLVYLPSAIKKIRTTWVKYFVYFLVLAVFVASFVIISIQKDFNLLSYETFLIV